MQLILKKLKNANQRSYLGGAIPPGRSPTAQLPDKFTAADIKGADIKAVQKMLKGEFEAAATNWKRWKAVMYAGKERRPLNPRKH